MPLRLKWHFLCKKNTALNEENCVVESVMRTRVRAARAGVQKPLGGEH
jgi:hypothetical protein